MLDVDMTEDINESIDCLEELLAGLSGNLHTVAIAVPGLLHIQLINSF